MTYTLSVSNIDIGTNGLGAATVTKLAQHNLGRIIFTGRDAKAAESVIGHCRAVAPDSPVCFVPCDLSDLKSVKIVAEQIISENARLDILMCNAGILGGSPGVSADGYEITFATNYLGHALLIRKLMPLLEKTAETHGSSGTDAARVLIIASPAFRVTPAGGIEFDTMRTTQAHLGIVGMWKRYGQSKLANVLYARELAARYPSVLALSVSPGAVSTGMINNLGWVFRVLIYISSWFNVQTPEEGALNQLWAASVRREDVYPGSFYEPVAYLSPLKTQHSEDPELQRRLWEWTEAELEQWL